MRSSISHVNGPKGMLMLHFDGSADSAAFPIDQYNIPEGAATTAASHDELSPGYHTIQLRQPSYSPITERGDADLGSDLQDIRLDYVCLEIWNRVLI